MMLAYSSAFLHLREPDVGHDPSHCHSVCGFDSQICIGEKSWKLLGGSCGVLLVSEGGGLPKLFLHCT